MNGERLAAAFLGGRPPLIVARDRVRSTNALAKELAREVGAVSGVFVADEQTGGRGRGERVWASPPGGIYVSILFALDAPDDPVRLGLVPIAAGVAAAEALREVSGTPVSLRWPNDLDGARGKVGGVLVEAGFAPGRPELAVAGFGINVGRPPPVADARIPPDALPGDVSREAAAAAIFRAFERTRRLSAGDIAARWDRLSPSGRGCRCAVRLRDGVELVGETVGLDRTGAIRVRAGGSVRIVHASDAVVIRHRAV